MGVSKRAPVCMFCRREIGVRLAFLVYEGSFEPGDTPPRLPRSLCPEHFRILDEAGERGRVYKPNGRRWWLADHYVGSGSTGGLSYSPLDKRSLGIRSCE